METLNWNDFDEKIAKMQNNGISLQNISQKCFLVFNNLVISLKSINDIKIGDKFPIITTKEGGLILSVYINKIRTIFEINSSGNITLIISDVDTINSSKIVSVLGKCF